MYSTARLPCLMMKAAWYLGPVMHAHLLLWLSSTEREVLKRSECLFFKFPHFRSHIMLIQVVFCIVLCPFYEKYCSETIAPEVCENRPCRLSAAVGDMLPCNKATADRPCRLSAATGDMLPCNKATADQSSLLPGNAQGGVSPILHTPTLNCSFKLWYHIFINSCFQRTKGSVTAS
jgi:hypothetical protein